MEKIVLEENEGKRFWKFGESEDPVTDWLLCNYYETINGSGTRCLDLLFWLGDMKSLKVKACVCVFLAKVAREVTKEKSHFCIISIYIVRWQQIVTLAHRCYRTQMAKGKQNHTWWREFLPLRLEVKTNEVIQSTSPCQRRIVLHCRLMYCLFLNMPKSGSFATCGLSGKYISATCRYITRPYLFREQSPQGPLG